MGSVVVKNHQARYLEGVFIEGRPYHRISLQLERHPGEKNLSRQLSHHSGRLLGMKAFRTLTVPEQVAAHLRNEIEEGRLQRVMPGVLRLEAEMGVNRKTVEEALRLLEREGVLVPQGAGRCRKIAGENGLCPPKALRLAILTYEKCDRNSDYIMDLQHRLQEAGHIPIFPAKSLIDLGMDVRRVARMVGQTEADGWVVESGSREVLEWFASNGVPVMALFGRRRQLHVASVGPDKLPALRAASKALLDLGHRRIVYMTRRANLLPQPGAAIQVLLDELTAMGVTPGPYHVPEWKETPAGYHVCLEELFRVTPPTALIVGDLRLLIATQQFITSMKLSVPRDLSLVCTDGSPDFAWCRPMISHIRWDSRPVVRRIVRWVNHLAHGRPDQQHVFTPAEFVRGGSIGPAAAQRQ
jgi:DNA-binding LacI/PurR family transcriptional regulator